MSPAELFVTVSSTGPAALDDETPVFPMMRRRLGDGAPPAHGGGLNDAEGVPGTTHVEPSEIGKQTARGSSAATFGEL